jgi:osmotically-inducible protein OsmY
MQVFLTQKFTIKKRKIRYLITNSLLFLLMIAVIGFSQNITDREITLAVEDALNYEEGVDAILIDVDTNEGIVELSGFTSNLLSKEQAAEVARTIKGVRSVVNEIVVRGTIRSDEVIKLDVEKALLNDPATESYEITTTVSEGVVTLKGTVQSWQEKQLATEVAMGVKGVKGVSNELILEYPESRPDLEIKQDVEGRLRSDVWIDEWLIDVTVNNGDVYLVGTVGSAQEKRWAMADAWVMGVKSVNADDLEINWWLEEDEKRDKKYAHRTDEEIKDAVIDALIYDPRVLAVNIDVEVENSVVTLTGVVDNLKAKMVAAEDASHTTGVIRVKNYVRTRPDELVVDEILAGKVTDAFIRDPYLEIHDIVVTAFNGRVFLNGEVNTLFEKEHAEDVAGGVIGVVDVVNNLEYRPVTVAKTDWELKEDIQRGLFWSPLIDEDDITVFVEDGTVTLSGEVDNINKRITASDIAYDAGADWVKNEIEVEGVPEINQ